VDHAQVLVTLLYASAIPVLFIAFQSSTTALDANGDRNQAAVHLFLLFLSGGPPSSYTDWPR
jgi:hypothetical protein